MRRNEHAQQEHMVFWARVDEALQAGRSYTAERVHAEEDIGRQQAEVLRVLRAERKRVERMIQPAENGESDEDFFLRPASKAVGIATAAELGELHEQARAVTYQTVYGSPRRPPPRLTPRQRGLMRPTSARESVQVHTRGHASRPSSAAVRLYS